MCKYCEGMEIDAEYVNGRMCCRDVDEGKKR
jgi:hypothetical protein